MRVLGVGTRFKLNVRSCAVRQTSQPPPKMDSMIAKVEGLKKSTIQNKIYGDANEYGSGDQKRKDLNSVRAYRNHFKRHLK